MYVYVYGLAEFHPSERRVSLGSNLLLSRFLPCRLGRSVGVAVFRSVQRLLLCLALHHARAELRRFVLRRKTPNPHR